MWRKIITFYGSLLFLISVTCGSQPRRDNTTVCEYLNGADCEKNRTLCEPTKEICPEPDYKNKRNHCYASWSNESGSLFVMKGCWHNDPACYDRYDCTSMVVKKDIHFCCCEGDMCNKETKEGVIFTTTTPSPVHSVGPQTRLVPVMLYSLMPIICLAIIIVLVYYCWKRQQMSFHDPLPLHEPLPEPESLTEGVQPVQLIEIKARGRYGSVWKGRMQQQVVAVKIFPIQDKQSWISESEFFNLPLVGNHENILHFIASEKRPPNSQMYTANVDYWLITEFHEKGSLYDHLKGNALTWSEMLKIAHGIARGLAFVHEDILPTKVSGHKPSVAHRDFKSKNVLVKRDLTACVADFGLALIFKPGESMGDTHSQVGTRRYMAPEVLEGAISFNRDAFLRIDMYACGLVLWELASRCSITGPVEDYKQPFEEQVGQQPSLADLQHHVVTSRNRPHIRDHWRKHTGMDTLLQTIEECWDQDPEARLSAGCVEERLAQLMSPPVPDTNTNHNV